MVTEPSTRLLTVEEFEALGPEADRCELIDGVLRPMPYAGFRHRRVALDLARPLADHVEEHGLGEVVVEVGFVIGRDPAQVLVPDVASVRAGHVPAPEMAHRIVQAPPALAVELRSPSDRPGEVDDKVRRYLAAGVPVVWPIDPPRRGGPPPGPPAAAARRRGRAGRGRRAARLPLATGPLATGPPLPVMTSRRLSPAAGVLGPFRPL